MSPSNTSLSLRSLDEFDRGRPALARSSRCSCRYEAGGSTMRLVSRSGFSSAWRKVKGGALVVLGDEAAVHMAGADAHFQHDRRVRRLGQLEAVLDRLDDRFQVWPRIEQPDLRLHGEGVRALLHDRGAFAVVLADDDQRAAGDAARGKVGQGVGGDIGADGRLEGDRAADRIHHRGGERGCRRRFRGETRKCTPSLARMSWASASTSIRCEIGAPW